jgi:hypothetical protein
MHQLFNHVPVERHLGSFYLEGRGGREREREREREKKRRREVNY